MLKCLYLSERFVDVPAHQRGQHLLSLEHTIRVDDEPASGLHTRILVIDPVDSAHLATCIRFLNEASDAVFDCA